MNVESLAAGNFQKIRLLRRIAPLLKGRIEQELKRMNLKELMDLHIKLHDHVRARLKENGKGYSPGGMYRGMKGSSLFWMMAPELNRAADEEESPTALGELRDLSDDQIRSYMIWRSDHQGGTFDEWKRARAKVERSFSRAWAKNRGERTKGGEDRTEHGSGSLSLSIRRGNEGSKQGVSSKKDEVRAYGPRSYRGKKDPGQESDEGSSSL